MTHLLPIKIDTGDGTPLVLLHGLGNNYKSWDFVRNYLDTATWRVIALDLLGFGDAPKPDVAYTPKDHADAIIETLDSLGIDTAVIAGHSMGCIVAIEIAHHYPTRVKHLALFGAPLYKQQPRDGWWRKITRAEGHYFSLFEIVKNNPDAVKAGGTIADELLPFVKGMEITDKVWPAYRRSLENTIMQYESYYKATKLKVPTLFVNGLLDFFIIRRNVRDIRNANRRHVRIKRTLGPHELTPRQGRTGASILSRLIT
ncbi:MAG TPA: alpha/beta hydrolase [Candidatus Saccharibacteria bacterium]|nr:alpha/beta hydrolase [Candidatus Saccharibacteria bacterium]